MSIVNSLLKVFLGDKSGKDLKKLTPLVDEINKHFHGMSDISNDELRELFMAPKRTYEDFRNKLKIIMNTIKLRMFLKGHIINRRSGCRSFPHLWMR